MKKISIVFILSIYSIFASGQVINEVLLDMGFNVNTYEIKSKSGFSNNSDAEEISVFINLLGRKKISEKISCDSGFGISREILGFNPLIKVSEVKGLENSGLDTLTIAKIGNWDWQFQLPLSFSYKLYDQINVLPPLIIIPGVRITTGITNRITFDRINTDNIIINNYYETNGNSFEYFDENLNRKISDYYSKKIKSYNLMMDLGLEFFYKMKMAGFLGGIKYNRFLLSPLDCFIKNKFSMTGYIGICYEINRR